MDFLISESGNRRIYIYLINNPPVGRLMYGRVHEAYSNAQSAIRRQSSTGVLHTGVRGTNVLAYRMSYLGSKQMSIA